MKLDVATQEDVIPVTKLALQFYRKTKWNDIRPIEASVMRESILGLIMSPISDIIIVRRGEDIIGAAGMVSGAYWANPSLTLASEIFWYINPDFRRSKAGKLLFEGMDAWTAQRRCLASQLQASAGEEASRLKNVYTSKGYDELEHSYLKKL